MFAAVSDDMIDAMSVTGSTREEIRNGLGRYAGVVDHAMLYSPSISSTPERVEENTASLIAAVATDAGRPG